MNELLSRMLKKYRFASSSLVLDEDDTNAGVVHYTQALSYSTHRYTTRKNSAGQWTHYYNYMDTAHSALAPFAPEMIEILRPVYSNLSNDITITLLDVIISTHLN